MNVDKILLWLIRLTISAIISEYFFGNRISSKASKLYASRLDIFISSIVGTQRMNDYSDSRCYFRLTSYIHAFFDEHLRNNMLMESYSSYNNKFTSFRHRFQISYSLFSAAHSKTLKIGTFLEIRF